MPPLIEAGGAATERGVVDLARAMANEPVRHRIRVYTIQPAGVRTALTGALSRTSS